MITKTSLPCASVPDTPTSLDPDTDTPASKPNTPSTPPPPPPPPQGKPLYPTSGSGIPELKTLLSGFTIPSLLTPSVLITKSLGAIFAVSSNLCLGKEGPFVHISTCIGHLVGTLLPKYATNGRKMRELLSASCSAGLSVAFGAPIGGVLFSYEEVSSFFPRKVLWRAFLCSATAALVLRELNPTGTGKLVLFESQFSRDGYEVVHYFVFVLLGVAGGVFGGLFCKANFLWARWFRAFGVIKEYPVLEVAIVVAVTALVQFPNPLVREMGDVVVKKLLVDCGDDKVSDEWVCRNEGLQQAGGVVNWSYVGWLVHGTLAKLVLTTITFGIKVPSGVIIPALDAGALFGRLVGQLIGGISPGIFAMVGAAAFLAGVSRMTISLAVIVRLFFPFPIYCHSLHLPLYYQKLTTTLSKRCSSSQANSPTPSPRCSPSSSPNGSPTQYPQRAYTTLLKHSSRTLSSTPTLPLQLSDSTKPACKSSYRQSAPWTTSPSTYLQVTRSM